MNAPHDTAIERAPQATQASASANTSRRPRLGFLGVGWIGRHRMQAVAEDGCADIVVIADAARTIAEEARALAPRATIMGSLEDMLAQSLDGVVIATPSALHAAQAQLALDRGMAVFCQKPLARTAQETACVIAAARRADRLLGVDLSYRHTSAMRAVRDVIASGAIGDVYAIDLVFHNAYGPDKAWFRDPLLSGGGCVIDLGIHLVDLALWTLDFPAVVRVSSRLYAQGRLLPPNPEVVEDFAVAQIELANDATARLACSWNLSAGCDAVIEASFHGTRGGVSLRNVQGSFYDFVAERYDGTRRTRLASPPDEWGGRAAVTWARQLRDHPGYDAGIEHLQQVACVLDAIYGR
ncbi:MAG TPA: Gfo/Idh/MocA family oxidoreductase [Casimicrobiaceae bacterium]|nr:Gfo/Idh/MocA family oxidoreductase [Casimicrobiaceae bacterium]